MILHVTKLHLRMPSIFLPRLSSPWRSALHETLECNFIHGTWRWSILVSCFNEHLEWITWCQTEEWQNICGHMIRFHHECVIWECCWWGESSESSALRSRCDENVLCKATATRLDANTSGICFRFFSINWTLFVIESAPCGWTDCIDFRHKFQ